MLEQGSELKDLKELKDKVQLSLQVNKLRSSGLLTPNPHPWGSSSDVILCSVKDTCSQKLDHYFYGVTGAGL